MPDLSIASAAANTAPTHRWGRAVDDRVPFSPIATGAGSHAARAEDNVAAADSKAAAAGASAGKGDAADEDGITFGDLLDVINPLQHLPVISTLYREWTGDEIGPVAKVIGGGLFGGVLGAASSLVDAIVEETTGDDMGGHVMTALFGGDETEGDAPADTGTMVAQGESPPAPEAITTASTAAAAQADAAAKPAAKPAAMPSDLPGGAKADPAAPQLSPAAFEALMNSFGQDAAPASPSPASPGLPPVAYGTPATPGRLFDRAL